MRKRNSDEFEITLPPEQRHESRTPRRHSYSEWKIKQIEYNHRCAYCGRHKGETREKYLTRDHVIPVIHDGTDDISNIVPACVACNFAKSTYAPGQINQAGLVVPTPKPRQRFRRWSRG